jgi:N-terminal domain of anti-restriction factor ArdC
MHRKFTPDPEAAAEKRAALVHSLEAGFTRVQSSEEYRAYLSTLARFHNYSLNNVLLIYMQRPDAQRVAGFHTWQSLGRNVRKGEKGISILAPCTYKTTVKDAETGEEEQRLGVRGFRAVSVFDVAQTEGADLPEVPCTRLTGDDGGLVASLEAIATAEGLTIDRTPGRAGASTSGFYIRDKKEIWVAPDLEPAATAKTLCHELGHHFAGHVGCRGEAETIAESTAYLVLGHFGIDAGDYSFGYLSSWSDLPTFRAALTEVNCIATRIIDSIDGDGDGMAATATAAPVPVAPVAPVAPLPLPPIAWVRPWHRDLCVQALENLGINLGEVWVRRAARGKVVGEISRIRAMSLAQLQAAGRADIARQYVERADPLPKYLDRNPTFWISATYDGDPPNGRAAHARERVLQAVQISMSGPGWSREGEVEPYDWSWAVSKLHPEVWASIDGLLQSERHAA